MPSNKKISQIVAIILVLLVAGWLVWKQTTKHESNVPANNTNATLESDKDAAKDLPQAQALEGQMMEGTLKVSDNAQKGNLMLVTASTTLYIFTSRDYSSLVDKQVKVIYDGTPEDFRLGDIVAK